MDINRQTEVDTPGQGGKGQQRPAKTGVPGRRSCPIREGRPALREERRVTGSILKLPRLCHQKRLSFEPQMTEVP